MSKAKFLEIMDMIKSAYGDRFQDLTKDVVNTWYGFFNECDYDALKDAVYEYIKDNKFPPTICELYQMYKNESAQQATKNPCADWQ